MSILKEKAASGNHVDSPPRLGSSRCGNYHNSATVSNQVSSGMLNANQKTPGEKVNQELLSKKEQDFSIIEQVVMQGDLSKLNPEQRVTYYRKVCESSGLNPFTNPFAYILLNGKLTLYAKKDCTEQLRKINGVSIESLDDKLIDDIYVVTAMAKDKNGRIDQAKGAVAIGNLKGEAKANAIMKAETKAKRRVTLSICGMGWTDESEIDSIPNARPVDVDFGTGEIKDVSPVTITPTVAPIPQAIPPAPVNVSPKINADQVAELAMILDECDAGYKKWVYERVKNQFKTDDLTGLTVDMYDRTKTAALKNMQQHHAKQRAEQNPELVAAEVQ